MREYPFVFVGFDFWIVFGICDGKVGDLEWFELSLLEHKVSFESGCKSGVLQRRDWQKARDGCTATAS